MSRSTCHDASRTHAVEERSGWVICPGPGRLPAVAAGRNACPHILSTTRRYGARRLRPGALPGRRRWRRTGRTGGEAAHWLAKQPTHGVIVSSGFPDYGLSIDTAFALKAIGGHRADVRKIRHAVEQNVDDYISGDSFGDPGSTYAGATAKALVLAQTTGGDPTSFGGVNLVGRLTAHVNKAGPAVGRIADQSTFGDFANIVGQILAVRGLTTAKSGQAGHVRAFLLKQQCRQGYFRLNFSKPGSAHQSCGKKSPADPDTTSYAVIQLWKVSKGNPALRGALKNAVAWLAKQQRKNGSFIGGTTTAFPNANSTGLAAVGARPDRSLLGSEVGGPLGLGAAGRRGEGGLAAGRAAGCHRLRPGGLKHARRTASPRPSWTSGGGRPARPLRRCCSGTAAECRCCGTPYASPP